MNEFKLFVLVVSSVVSTVKCQNGPTLTIPQGTLQGKYEVSRDGRQFYEFKGIPYGQVARRFEDSALASNWTGTLNATASSSGCLTYIPFPPTPGVIGREDCLDLDIYTPMIPGDTGFTEPLPVMIFFYGGGSYYGASYGYGGKYFMDEDVVLVIVNYRLTAFGLLQADVEGARGNQALKDMILSIKWVKQNIASFGGDPNRIVIFGESAGSKSIALLTMSKLTSGLISGAIMQSGMGTCPQAWPGHPGKQYAQKLAALLDCPTQNATKMVECLREVPAKDIAELADSPTDEFSWRRDAANGLRFSPTLETVSSEEDPTVFLSEHPTTLLQNGDFIRVPMIIGKIEKETYSGVLYYFNNAEFLNNLNREFGRRMPEYFLYDQTADDPCSVTDKIRDRFFIGESVTSDMAEQFALLMDERNHMQCIRTSADLYAKENQVYLYNFTKPRYGSSTPPMHADDLQYLFSYPDVGEILPSDPDYKFSKEMVSSWVTFAREGKPGKFSDGEEWAPLVPGQPHTWYEINVPAVNRVVDDSYQESWDWWDSLGLKGVGEISPA